MDFNYTDREKEIQKLAHDYAQNRIAPVALKYDEVQEFPWDIIKEIGEMGFLGVTFPEKYGGANFSAMEFSIIVEEISKADPSVGLTVAAHNSLCTNHIYMFASESLKEKYLPDLTAGKKGRCLGIIGKCFRKRCC